MITDSEIVEIGTLSKPHGINGEIVVSLDCDIQLDELFCIVIKVDGINVPYFIHSVRPKSNLCRIIAIDDISNEDEASALCGNVLYALKRDINDETEGDEDGFYATDLIGYTIIDGNIILGKIDDIDDSTENALFIVSATNGESCLIPIADEYIIDINPNTKTITMDLPEGLTELK